MSFHPILGVMCAWLAVVLPAWGSDGSGPVRTIPQLITQATRNNPELLYFESEVAAARGQRTQAGLWQNPEISGEYGKRRVTDNTGVLQGDGTTRSLSITQTFEFPGKGSLRKAIADKNIDLAVLGLQQFQRSLEGKVRTLALEYLASSANADAAAEISERSTALVNMLKERAATGTQQLLELRVIQGSLIDLQQSAKDFIIAREEARIELNTLLGFPPNQPLSIQQSPGLPPRLVNLDRLILSGLANNLQLKIRTAELERAGREVSAAKFEAAPNFSVGPFFSQDKAGDLEENKGVSLSVNVPIWNLNQGNIATAQARKTQADALLMDARRKMEAEIARRHRAYEMGRRQLEQIPESAISDLRDASDLADRQYRTGSIGVQLFLEVQREFLAAQRAQKNALLDVWKNWLDLQLLTGGSTTPITPKNSTPEKASR